MNGEANQPGFIPAITWLRDYQKPWIRTDIIAGLVAAAVVIPKAMAFATIAGLPVQVGLYTAFVPMVVYALLGTSRPLSVSTTTTISILTAADLARAVPNGGARRVDCGRRDAGGSGRRHVNSASLLRLGFIANFISDPVLAGFKAGIGLVIVLDQVPKLLGLHIVKAGFLRDFVAIIQHLPQTSRITLALSLVTILLMIGLERWAPSAGAVDCGGAGHCGFRSAGLTPVRCLHGGQNSA